MLLGPPTWMVPSLVTSAVSVPVAVQGGAGLDRVTAVDLEIAVAELRTPACFVQGAGDGQGGAADDVGDAGRLRVVAADGERRRPIGVSLGPALVMFASMNAVSGKDGLGIQLQVVRVQNPVLESDGAAADGQAQVVSGAIQDIGVIAGATIQRDASHPVEGDVEVGQASDNSTCRPRPSTSRCRRGPGR